MAQLVCMLMETGESKWKTVPQGREKRYLCHAIFRRQEVLKSSVFIGKLSIVKGGVDRQLQVKIRGQIGEWQTCTFLLIDFILSPRQEHNHCGH